MSSPYIFETMPPDSSEVKRVSVAPTLANIFGSPPNVTKSSEAPLLGPVPIPYIKLRTQLFQDAFFQSVNGAPFNDTQIYVFSARARSGVVHKPRVVHARSAFLETASAQFKNSEFLQPVALGFSRSSRYSFVLEIYKSCSVNTRGAVTRRRERSEDGYDDDSDLEDMEEEPEVGSSLHDTSGARSEEWRCVDDTKRASGRLS